MIAIAACVIGLLLMAGCAAEPQRAEVPRRLWAPASAEPATAPALRTQSEIRYYRDVEGALWNDRGRKLDNAEQAEAEK